MSVIDIKEIKKFDREGFKYSTMTGNPDGTNRPWNAPPINHFNYDSDSSKVIEEKESEEKQYYRLIFKEKSNLFTSSSTPSGVTVNDLM